MADATAPRRLTPTQAVTPAVLVAVRDAVTPTSQTTFADAQCVLRHLARWARGGEVAEAVSQIAVGTLLSERVVKRCLRVLEDAGVARVSARGGGRQKLATRRVLWLDWGGDGVLRSPFEPVDNEDYSGHDVAPVVPVDTEELRPVGGPSSDGNAGHSESNSGHEASNSGHSQSNSGHQVAHTDLSSDIDTDPSPSSADNSQLVTAEMVAQAAGDIHAEHTKRSGEPVTSMSGLSNWKRDKILTDRLERQTLDDVVAHANRYRAWAENEIPIRELGAAVLSGSIWRLQERYPERQPERPNLVVIETEREQVRPEPSGKSVAELLREAGAPERYINPNATVPIAVGQNGIRLSGPNANA